MEFFDTVYERQSIRKFQARPVEEQKITAILEAADRAPSAGNYQSYEIFVVRRQERISALAAATFDQKFIAEAPVALIFCTNEARCDYQPADFFALQDATIATTFAMLAITALGLATCWIGAFAPVAVATAMDLPSGLKPIAILPVGYGAEQPERTTRRALTEIVHEL